VRLRAFLALLPPHRADLLKALALLAVGALAPAASVWLLRSALGQLTSPGELATGGLLWTCAAFVAVYVAQSGAQVLRTGLTKRVSGEVASELRQRLHATLLQRPAEGAQGDRMAALLEEVDQVQYGVSALVTAVRNPITILMLLVTAVWLSPSLAALSVILFLPAVLAGWWAQGRVRRLAHEAQRERAALWKLTAEQLAGLDVLRAFGAEGSEQRRFREADTRDRLVRWRLEVARVSPSALVEVLAAMALGGLLLVGSRQVASGQTDGATLVSLVVTGMLVHRPVSGLAEVSTLLNRSLAALDRVQRALTPAEPVAAGTARIAPPVHVAWEEVSVRFGEDLVLDRLSAEARPGELVALVGPTGAGKTTLLRLLTGAVRPQSGRVRLGDREVGELEPAGLRALVAPVPQDTQLFARSVADNVALGQEPAQAERLRSALVAAGADFVLSWPQGAQTELAENGRGLSGGERSRLCLARALYRDAPLLLMDEPTAHLDPQTSEALVSTLCALRPGRTIVVATHDPLVWQRADRVVDLADQSRGKVGTHSQPSKG
jgi:ABC-type multidrug transport system fused ATPase/permease subunit